MTTEELTIEVEKALEEIRPFLNSDGGDLSLISIEDQRCKREKEDACPRRKNRKEA